MVAAFGNLEIGRVEMGGRDTRHGMIRQDVGRPQIQGGLIQRAPLLFQYLSDPQKLARSHKNVDFRQEFTQLLPVALGQTTGHDELPPGRLIGRQVQDRLNRLLLGRVNKAARIDHQDPGLFRVEAQRIARLRQQAEHDLAIHQIFRAAQIHQIHGLVRVGPGLTRHLSDPYAAARNAGVLRPCPCRWHVHCRCRVRCRLCPAQPSPFPAPLPVPALPGV